MTVNEWRQILRGRRYQREQREVTRVTTERCRRYLIVRPRLAFAALLSTSLVAVAVPAAAGSSDSAASPPDLGTITQQVSPSTASSPSPQASADTGSTTAGTQDPAAAVTTTTPAASDPAACIQGAGSNPLAILTCVTPSGGTNPLTGLVTQLQGLAGGGGAPGLSPAPFEVLAACVQSNLTATPPDGTKLEACFSTFAKSLTGAPQATCLDPILQGVIGAVQDLVEKQNPAPLQGELTGLQGQLTTLASCLQGAPAGTSSTSAPASTGTTTSSGGATTPSDPTEAVPVAATPTFTG
jgi:hypothetical protein